MSSKLQYSRTSRTLGSAAPSDASFKDTKSILTDPIWDTLRDNNCFNLVVRQCLVQAEHKGQLKKRVKAILSPVHQH